MGRRTFGKEYKLRTIKQVIEEGKRITKVSEKLRITEQVKLSFYRQKMSFYLKTYK